MSDSPEDLKNFLVLALEEKKWIRSINGRKMMEYDGLAHRLDNLNSIEVTGILSYKEDCIFIYRIGLYENPSFLLFRIYSIFSKIRLYDPEQQDDILNFFVWLKDMFMPFLARVERYIPDVRNQADMYMLERGIPTIENMLNLFQDHFIKTPLMVFRCILANRVPPKMPMTRFSWNSPITRLAMAKMYGFRCEVSPAMAARVGLTAEALSILLSNVENLSHFQGKPFYGKLLTFSVAQKFLIERLFCPKNWRESSWLVMQLLRRSFR